MPGGRGDLASHMHSIAHRPPGPPPGGVLPSVRTQHHYAPLQPDPTMKLRSSLRTLAFASVCTFATVFTPQVSSAAVVYDPSPTSGNVFQAGGTNVAIRFNTGAGNALDSFFIPVTFSNTSAKTVFFGLFADSGSTPNGAPLALFSGNFSSADTGAINATSTLLDFVRGPLGLGPGKIDGLSTNTNYWLALAFDQFSSAEALLTAFPPPAASVGGTGSPFAAATQSNSTSPWVSQSYVFDATISTRFIAPAGGGAGVPEAASVSV